VRGHRTFTRAARADRERETGTIALPEVAMLNAGELSLTAMNTGPQSTPASDPPLGRRAAIVSWIVQVVTAAILFQTLFFKFTGAEESVYIFSTLGMEPWGRIGSGVAELIACVLLLVPRTVPLGALLSLGVISGAIISHLVRLGIVVRDDGGLLFGLALTVLAGSLAVLAVRRRQLTSLRRAVMRASQR
jgi:uncharacterized membrane protein YphA (DoxX/SURF4 family)